MTTLTDYKEGRMLELAALGLHSGERFEEFERLLSGEYDIKVLIFEAIRHKLVPLLGYLGMEYDELCSNPVIRTFLKRAFRANRTRTRVLLEQVEPVLEELRRQSVPHAVTKGLALDKSLYGGLGVRSIGDVDLMLPSAYSSMFEAICDNFGFFSGRYSEREGRFVKRSRREELVYRLNPDHLPERCKVTGLEQIPAVYLDCATSFTWHSAEKEVDVEEAVASAETVDIGNGIMARVLNREYSLLFCILHFFREAWFGLPQDVGKSVNLSKCSDILRILEESSDACLTRFLTITKSSSVEREVWWVLQHLDETFSYEYVNKVGLLPPIDADSYLRSFAVTSNALGSWVGTFRDRLYGNAYAEQ